MKTSKSGIAAIHVLAVIGLILASVDARAAQYERSFSSNPTGICQPALPVYESAIRKRPKAMQNEGAAAAFITCSFTSQGAISKVEVDFASMDGSAHEVSCTGVLGAYFQVFGNESVVKQISVPATYTQSTMIWRGYDFSGTNGGPPDRYMVGRSFGVSCNLPPGAAITESRLFFTEYDD